MKLSSGMMAANPAKYTPCTTSMEFRKGFVDILPLAFGVAIYGTAFGVLAAQAGMTRLETGSMSVAVFAGSSQFLVLERLASGASAAAALVAAIAINLRILLMTASLRSELLGRPLWQKLLGIHWTTDENWALMQSKRLQGIQAGYWYLIGGGACLFISWIGSTISGVQLAAILPDPQTIAMDFAFTAAFIALLCGMWRNRSDLLPWIFAGGSCVIMISLFGLSPSFAMVLGALAGAFIKGLQPS